MVVRSAGLAGILLVCSVEGGSVWSASVEAVVLVVFVILISRFSTRRKS